MRRARVPRRPPRERPHETACGIRLSFAHKVFETRNSVLARHQTPSVIPGGGLSAFVHRIRTGALAATHPEDVEVLGVNGGCVDLPAQGGELALEPFALLAQALVDGASRADSLQLSRQILHALPQRPGPSGARRPPRRAALRSPLRFR